MQMKKWIALGGALLALSACSGNWSVDYEKSLETDLTRNWRLNDVIVSAPQSLRVSEANTYAPNADIVWHGEPYGDRRAQVAAIIDEGLTIGAQGLAGSRPVTITARVQEFHAVTPVAIARAPSAVHNILFTMQVYDTATGVALTEPQVISADLEAYVGTAAVAAAVAGETQRARIITHVAAVMRGYLGNGPDQRRSFSGLGR